MYLLVTIPHGAFIHGFVFARLFFFRFPSNIGYLSIAYIRGQKSGGLFGTRKNF